MPQISQLPAATTSTPGDKVPVTQDGITVQETVGQINAAPLAAAAAETARAQSVESAIQAIAGAALSAASPRVPSGSAGMAAGSAVLGSDGLVAPEDAPRISSIAALLARAYATLTDGALIHVLGYLKAGDGGGGLFRWAVASTAADDRGITIAPAGLSGAGRWVRDLSATARITAAMFGGIADATYTDLSGAYMAAAAAAAANGKALHIPGGSYPGAIYAPIILPPVSMRITGDKGASTLALLYNGPLFEYNSVGGVGIDGFDIGGFDVELGPGPGTAGNDYSQTCIIKFGGDASFIQYGRVHDILGKGLYCLFVSDKPTYTDPHYGPAGTVDWMHFDDITILPGARDSVQGVNFKTGSGTGSTYQGWKTEISASGSAIFNFGGGVVGDIIIDGHFGGNNTTLVAVAAGSTYCENINASNLQIDAGVDYPFSFPGPTQFSRILLGSSNIGGGVTVSLPPLQNSTIHDQLVSEWRAGNRKTFTGSGPQSIPIFAVTVGNSGDTYTATRCEISLHGIVATVAGGGCYGMFFAVAMGGTAAVEPIIASTPSNSAAGFFSITSSVSGNVVTYYATFDPPSAGTTAFDAQIIASGGTFSVQRL